MKTEPIYSQDAYIKQLEATVLETDDEGVILDKTIFYPRGGGQPTDRGLITGPDGNEYEVSGLKRVGDALLHHVPNGLKEGDKVTLKIDWDYRYQLMRHHTALHLLSAVVNKRFEETKVTGGNIYADRARLDFDLPQFNKEVALSIVDELNEIIQQDHKISVSFLSRKEAEEHPELFRTTLTLPESITEIRLVKIGDVDLQADGGLHVNSTKEIGGVELVKTDNKGKGRKRCTIKVVDQ